MSYGCEEETIVTIVGESKNGDVPLDSRHSREEKNLRFLSIIYM
jgi:hypothetical protein